MIFLHRCPKAAAAKQQLKQKCEQRLAVYKKKRDPWNYARIASNLQRFDVAIKYYQRMIKKDQGGWYSDTGGQAVSWSDTPGS